MGPTQMRQIERGATCIEQRDNFSGNSLVQIAPTILPHIVYYYIREGKISYIMREL